MNASLPALAIAWPTIYEKVSEERHQEAIARLHALKLASLDWTSEELCASLRSILDLVARIADIDRELVVVRLNRPGSTDFNPPHRDSDSSSGLNTVNLWIPIFNCPPASSIPLMAGSQHIAQADIYRTSQRGASINGRVYNVPAIIQTRTGDLRLKRAIVPFGSVPVFSPFPIHGIAVNNTNQVQISLELRLTIKDQKYPSIAAPTT